MTVYTLQSGLCLLLAILFRRLPYSLYTFQLASLGVIPRGLPPNQTTFIWQFPFQMSKLLRGPYAKPLHQTAILSFYLLSKYIILQNIQKVKILDSFLWINYRTMEEYVGIEPTALDWKSRILATIRILHGWFHPPREHTTNSTPYFQLFPFPFSFSLLLQDLYYFTLISSLYAQPIISEAKTARAFINGCAPYGSRLYSNDQTGQWDCAYPFRAYLRGALYFTKALKPSQFLVIDLTLRTLTQPKTRAFTTASGSSLPAQLLAGQGTFYATNPSHKRDDYRRAYGGTWRPQPQPVTGFTQSRSVELIDAGCSKRSIGQRLLSFSLYYSAITNDKPHIVALLLGL